MERAARGGALCQPRLMRLTTIRSKFLRRRRTWSTQAVTLLDGVDDVKLLSSDGQPVLATGSGASPGAKPAGRRVCGARSIGVGVIRGGAAARFTFQVRTPEAKESGGRLRAPAAFSQPS